MPFPLWTAYWSTHPGTEYKPGAHAVLPISYISAFWTAQFGAHRSAYFAAFVTFWPTNCTAIGQAQWTAICRTFRNSYDFEAHGTTNFTAQYVAYCAADMSTFDSYGATYIRAHRTTNRGTLSG